MADITLDFVPVRSKDILARANPGETVSIMNLGNVSHLYMADALAAQVWSLIDDKASLRDIAKKIILKHRPPAARFHKDLVAFIKELHKEGIIQ